MRSCIRQEPKSDALGKAITLLELDEVARGLLNVNRPRRFETPRREGRSFHGFRICACIHVEKRR